MVCGSLNDWFAPAVFFKQKWVQKVFVFHKFQLCIEHLGLGVVEDLYHMCISEVPGFGDTCWIAGDSDKKILCRATVDAHRRGLESLRLEQMSSRWFKDQWKPMKTKNEKTQANHPSHPDPYSHWHALTYIAFVFKTWPSNQHGYNMLQSFQSALTPWDFLVKRPSVSDIPRWTSSFAGTRGAENAGAPSGSGYLLGMVPLPFTGFQKCSPWVFTRVAAILPTATSEQWKGEDLKACNGEASAPTRML